MKTFLTRDQFTQYYTATGGETQITLTRTVCRTNTDFAVFRNGLFQTPGSTADYVFIDRYGVEASNTEAFVSAIKFNTALSLNDKVSIVSGVISGTNLTDIYNYIGDTGVSTNLTTPYNLNNLIHGGRYFLAYNAGNTNCPVSVDCHIQVFQQDSNNMVQTIYPIDGTSPVWRSYSNGTWNGWNTYSNAPVGSIVSVLASDTYVPNGCLRCDGIEYTSAMFSGFYNNFLLTGKLLTCTYAEYTAQVAITGNCGKFALDTVNGKFKVPKLKDGDSITQASSAAELGKSVKAGLPNAKARLPWWAGGTSVADSPNTTGVAYHTPIGTGITSLYDMNGSGVTARAIEIDLKRASPVYQDGVTTVLDEQVRLRHFVVVANAQTIISSVDWSSVISGKANVDLSNATGNAIWQYAHIRDVKPTNTNGGTTSTAAWQTRDLNTVVKNNIGAVLNASNQVVLQPGTYKIVARIPGAACNRMRTALYSVTTSSYLLYSPSCFSDYSYPSSVYAVVEGEITLTVATTLELRMWCQTGLAAVGMGYASNAPGVPEIYSELFAWKK